MATLRVLSTLARELEGRSFALGAEGASLGRDGANRIVIPEASVSRRHARIEVAGSVYHLVDQRSANGMTALLMAARMGFAELCAALLDAGKWRST